MEQFVVQVLLFWKAPHRRKLFQDKEMEKFRWRLWFCGKQWAFKNVFYFFCIFLYLNLREPFKNICLIYITTYKPASLFCVDNPLTFSSTDPSALGQTLTSVMLAQWCFFCPRHLLASFCIADRKSQEMSATILQLFCTNSIGVSRLPAEPHRAMPNLAASLWGQPHTAGCWRAALDSRTACDDGRVWSWGRARGRKLQANG